MDRIIHKTVYPNGSVSTVIQEDTQAKTDVYGIKVTVDGDRVSWQGKKQSVVFRRYSLLSFRGLPNELMVSEVRPTGLVLIDAETSVPRFRSWHSLLSGNSIFRDCLMITGWLQVK
jgi:hypothetical protein